MSQLHHLMHTIYTKKQEICIAIVIDKKLEFRPQFSFEHTKLLDIRLSNFNTFVAIKYKFRTMLNEREDKW